jgi:hypothetical protein
MSRHMDLFIGTQENVEALKTDLAQVLKVELRSVNLPDIIASAYGGNWGIRLLEIMFSTDEELLDLTPYQYYLEIQAHNAPFTEYPERRREVARTIFDQLKITGRYRLLLVENLEDILAKFDPE